MFDKVSKHDLLHLLLPAEHWVTVYALVHMYSLCIFCRMILKVLIDHIICRKQMLNAS